MIWPIQKPYGLELSFISRGWNRNPWDQAGSNPTWQGYSDLHFTELPCRQGPNIQSLRHESPLSVIPPTHSVKFAIVLFPFRPFPLTLGKPHCLVLLYLFYARRERRCPLYHIEILQKKYIKTTAPRIPAWSPTVVLTRRHSG
jgi:hypothetical protein